MKKRGEKSEKSMLKIYYEKQTIEQLNIISHEQDVSIPFIVRTITQEFVDTYMFNKNNNDK